MAIIISQSIVVPATTTPEIVYNAVWISNISIIAPRPTVPVRAVATFVPYSTDTGDILTNKSKTIMIQDVFNAATGNTELSNAMSSILLFAQNYVSSNNLFGSGSNNNSFSSGSNNLFGSGSNNLFGSGSKQHHL